MAKLVSERRPNNDRQPVLEETSAPSGAVIVAGYALIALLVAGAVIVVVAAFAR